MNTRNIVTVLIAVGVLIAGWQYGGWGGLALAITMMVTYVLIQLSSMLRVLRGAANREKGRVASAETLASKLKRGMGLIQVIRLTGSIGDALTPEGQQPEVFRWADAGGASVTCEFNDGRLAGWTFAPAP
jgi:hypothetical protein